MSCSARAPRGDEERLRDVPVAMPGAVATAVCGVGARLQDQLAALAPGAMETALAPGANRRYASCVMTGSGPQILAARWKRGSPALRAELGTRSRRGSAFEDQGEHQQ